MYYSPNTPVLNALQANFNAKYGFTSSMQTFNGYSEDELNAVLARYEKEAYELNQKRKTLIYAAQKSRTVMDDEIESVRKQLPITALIEGWSDVETERYWNKFEQNKREDHESKFHWRDLEIKDRLDVIYKRISQLKSTDNTGAFIDRCLELEKQIETFIAQIQSSIDTYNPNTMTYNQSMFAPFQ